MRLMRLGQAGAERPVVLVGDVVVEVGDLVHDYDERFFAADRWRELAEVVGARVAAGDVAPLGGERVGAPIARPHQILCVGLNFAEHATESGMVLPDEPLLFSKSPNTLVGPDDDVVVPRGSTKLDWEVELGVVVGRRCSYLASREEAEAAIAGYLVVNDVSERAFQLERGGQWLKGKSAPTFNPAGPWLVTPDEIADLAALGMRLDVNGERRQDGSTSTMVFDPAEIVRYVSQFLVLEPGDLINTGTPHGVGMGMSPPQYLRPGDVMELEIDGLGRQRQRVVASG